MKKTSAKPAREPADYCRDFNDWPEQWMVVDADLKTGRRPACLFYPLCRFLDGPGTRQENHPNHSTISICSDLKLSSAYNDGDASYRKLPGNALILKYVDDETGPLLSFWGSG